MMSHDWIITARFELSDFFCIVSKVNVGRNQKLSFRRLQIDIFINVSSFWFLDIARWFGRKNACSFNVLRMLLTVMIVALFCFAFVRIIFLSRVMRVCGVVGIVLGRRNVSWVLLFCSRAGKRKRWNCEIRVHQITVLNRNDNVQRYIKVCQCSQPTWGARA